MGGRSQVPGGASFKLVQKSLRQPKGGTRGVIKSVVSHYRNLLTALLRFIRNFRFHQMRQLHQ